MDVLFPSTTGRPGSGKSTGNGLVSYTPSKAPSFTLVRNACHSSRLSLTGASPRFAELRRITVSPVAATSTHAPLSHRARYHTSSPLDPSGMRPPLFRLTSSLSVPSETSGLNLCQPEEELMRQMCRV